MADAKADTSKTKRKRENPVAQFGNYAAEVDTAGMDPEMKVLGGVAKKRKPVGFMDILRKLRNPGGK